MKLVKNLKSLNYKSNNSSKSFLIVNISLIFVLILNPNFWTIQNIVDGNYYSSLMISGPDIFKHFDLENNYFWTRSPIYLPGYVLTKLFGAFNGYLIYRIFLLYLTLILSTLAIRHVLKNNSAVIIFNLLIVTSPVYILMLTNDIHYFVVIPYLLCLIFSEFMLIRTQTTKYRFLLGMFQGVIMLILVSAMSNIPAVLFFVLTKILINFMTFQYSFIRSYIGLFFGFSISWIAYELLNIQIFSRSNILILNLKTISEFRGSEIWKYFKTQGLTNLNHLIYTLTFLYILFIVVMFIVDRRNLKRDTKIFLVLNSIFYGLNLLYLLYSQFMDQNSMGLLELGFHGAIGLTSGLILLSFYVANSLDNIKPQKLWIYLVTLISLYFLYRLPRFDLNIVPWGLFFICLFLIFMFLMKVVRKPMQIICVNLMVIGFFITTLYSNTSIVPPGAANISGPSFWQAYSSTIEHRGRWIQSAEFSEWVFKLNIDNNNKILTWLLPVNKDGVDSLWTLDQWSAAGMLFWGGVYSIRVDSLNIQKFQPDITNRFEFGGKYSVVTIADSLVESDKAKNIIVRSLGDNVLKKEDCKRFFNQDKGFLGCVYELKF